MKIPTAFPVAPGKGSAAKSPLDAKKDPPPSSFGAPRKPPHPHPPRVVSAEAEGPRPGCEGAERAANRGREKEGGGGFFEVVERVAEMFRGL